MDSLSINPATSATGQPAALVANATANKSTTATAGPSDVKPKEAAPENETSTPPRDSRSVQYMVQGNRVITTIVDDNSKKVVVQIPDAELIRIAKSIDRMQGFFIEQTA